MPQTRRILACDGGGIRGIITLRCLEALEARVGPLYQYFDMFAGTSTGAVIAGSLAAGIPIDKLIQTYIDKRREIYARSPLWWAWPLVTKYRKRPMHRFLMETFEDRTLADLKRDILITAVDTVRSETTYFTSFLKLGSPTGRYGTYQNVRLRDAVEASASAPTYFRPHGRFIDGGSTVYINPAYVAAVEAMRYSSDRKQNQPSRYDNARIEVYSFGTGAFARSMRKGQAMKTRSLCWVPYLINESASQAGELHSYVTHSELDIAQQSVILYRHDVYFTRKVLQEAMPGSEIDPERLDLDAVDDERFGLLDAIGKMYARRLFAAPDGDWNPPATTFPAPRASNPAVSAAIAARAGAAGYWDQYGREPMPPG